VYGGGGIMPDIFMPHDTMSHSEYYYKISRAGLFYQFSMEYVDSQRSRLEKDYKTFSGFDKKFHVSEELFEKFLAYTEKQGIARDAKGLELSGNEMRIQLKAHIARTLWDISEYYEIINKHIDPCFIKAVEVLNNWKQYN
jgi:carboxyl-terminal processing protease